jgi:hypothetical protein
MIPAQKTMTPHVVRAQAAATSSYVAGTVFSMDEHNYLALEVTYLKGDETSHQIKVECSDDGGTTYYQQVTKTTSGGTTDIVPNVYTITAGSYSSGTSLIVIDIVPIKAGLIRVSTKATGGTPTGTIGIKAFTAWA